MENSGAIPKSKGARPKTKVVNNYIPKKEKNYEELPAKINSVKSSRLSLNGTNFEENKRPHIGTKTFEEVASNPGNILDLHSLSTFHDTNTNQGPLEKREIIITDEGVQYKCQALSPNWIEKRLFLHYTSPPMPTNEGEYVVGAMDAWTEQMEFLVEDLSWLLKLPHHKFWSEVVYDKSVQECLQFYLMNGPRWYDKVLEDESVLSVISDIHQLVFLIYVRMATYKETKEDYITPSVFGELIYNNFLYDVCKILDLCVLYGTTNRPLLEKMINCIFTHQPKYFDDLGELSLSIANVLKNLEEKLGIYDFGMPSSLSSENKLNIEELSDLISYLLDTCCSLQAFLSIFPKACQTFYEKEFELRLSGFYEKVIPKLMEEVMCQEKEEAEELLSRVNFIRQSCLSIFREILSWVGLRENLDSLECSLSRNIESFTHILTTCVEEKIFITDYNATYDLKKDLAYFEEKGADMTTLDFIREAVNSIVKEIEAEYSSLGDPVQVDFSTNYEALSKGDRQGVKVGDTSGMNGYYAGETCSLSDIEIESLVSVVRDLFPELGTGFVKECLRYYSYSSEEVLNAILEKTLPPHLESLDRTLEDSPLSVTEVIDDVQSTRGTSDHASSTSDVLVNRLNIYDDDEFDVFKRPVKVDRNKIHKGKRKNIQYEKDPELTEKMKVIIHQYESNLGYSIYEDEVKYSPIVSTEYNDEYDDTYDDNEAGDVDNFSDEKRRFERVPNIIGRGALNAPLIFSDDEEEEEGGGGEEESEERKVEESLSKDKSNETKWKRGNEAKNKEPYENNRYRSTTERFKKANASYKRGYGARDQSSWNATESMTFTNSFRVPNHGKAEESSTDGDRNLKNRSDFEPFCENPQETRRRMQRKMMNKQFKNKGYCNQSLPNTAEGESTSVPPPKASAKTNKHSGKAWRQGAQGDDSENRRHHGGKYKEDTNHGKAQDRTYRYKMTHKNEQRRQASQAKYRNNF